MRLKMSSAKWRPFCLGPAYLCLERVPPPQLTVHELQEDQVIHRGGGAEIIMAKFEVLRIRGRPVAKCDPLVNRAIQYDPRSRPILDKWEHDSWLNKTENMQILCQQLKNKCILIKEKSE